MSSVYFISASLPPCSFNYRESQISVIIIHITILHAFVHVCMSLILYVLQILAKVIPSSSWCCIVFLANLHQSSTLFDHAVCVDCCSSHIELQTDLPPLFLSNTLTHTNTVVHAQLLVAVNCFSMGTAQANAG